MKRTRRAPPNVLTVLDLFCGPGGLSEGFRQAGFRIVAGFDKDKWAIETFRKNHLESEAKRVDLLTADLGEMPEVDVLIGGPPCIEFSSSKRGGNGNVLEGLLLVQAFLRFVYFLRPRWWIMENVPRITRFLPAEVPLRWIGIERNGMLPVPARAVFNTADYGVPQARQRFLMGNFPIPETTHFDPTHADLPAQAERKVPWRTLGELLSTLPDPLSKPGHGEIEDFNYGFSIRAQQLSDHFYPCILSEAEVRHIRRAKELHPFYGRMKFPDDLGRPARTVVATQLGRETLVIGSSLGGRTVFRRATVRECASLQTFPITYQFWGPLNTRYRLAGDAVPPFLSYAIGRKILSEEKKPLPKAPRVRREIIEISPPAPLDPLLKQRRKSRFPLSRRFREFVPGKEVRGSRVDLDNQGPKPGRVATSPKLVHLCEWVARLYSGEGQGMQRQTVGLEEALREFAGFCQDDRSKEVADRFLRAMGLRLRGHIPDATTLQAAWCGLTDNVPTPYDIVEVLSSIVNEFFPKGTYREVRIPRSGAIQIVPPNGLRVRIAAGVVVTAFACELINNDPQWMVHNADRRFVLPTWSADGQTSKTSQGRAESMVADRFNKLIGRRMRTHI